MPRKKKEQIIDWDLIKYDYENTPITLADLEKKYNVNYLMIVSRAVEENWIEYSVKLKSQLPNEIDIVLSLADIAKSKIVAINKIMFKLHEQIDKDSISLIDASRVLNNVTMEATKITKLAGIEEVELDQLKGNNDTQVSIEITPVKMIKE